MKTGYHKRADYHNKFHHYEFQVKPQTWFGKLFAIVMLIALLWLAIVFFTGFLLVACVLAVCVAIYSTVFFTRNKASSGDLTDHHSATKYLKTKKAGFFEKDKVN